MSTATNNKNHHEYSTDAVTLRGMKCWAHLWNVKTPPKALIVLFHGFLAHGKYPTVRYAAEALAEEGYSVVAVDLPGHGQSEGLRGYLSSAKEVVEDGIAIVHYAKELVSPDDENDKDLKIFLVGSSMGGAIALSVAQQMKTATKTTLTMIAGVVLLAPMLQLNVSSVEHTALQCLAFLMPTLPLIPSSATDDSKQYRDEAKRQECADDPLTVSGSKLRVGSALACVDLTLQIRQEQFSDITCPFLLMIADQDVVVKNAGSQQLWDRSPSTTDKTQKKYPALHGLLCEPSPLVDEIKKDMLQWIQDRL